MAIGEPRPLQASRAPIISAYAGCVVNEHSLSFSTPRVNFFAP
jgi:hypothetical protein